MGKQLESQTYNSPRWSREVLDCAMPMTFDTYSACSYNCLYCFSQFQRGICSADYNAGVVHSVNPAKVKALFRGEIENSQFNWYIKNRYTMQWGGLSEGFDEYERQFGVSLELLRFFREINYPISISTKAVWWLDDPRYIECLKDAKNIHVKVSIITTDERKAKLIEKGCPTVAKRFAALARLKELGIAGTTARFRPFILGVSAAYPFGPQSVKDLTDYVVEAASAGVDSVTTEFMCWEGRQVKLRADTLAILSAVAGFDIPSLYKNYSQVKTGLLRLNYEIKRPYIETLARVCADAGVEFFVSDANHKEKSCHACCCGIKAGTEPGHFFTGHFSEAMQIAKRNGFVRWADIDAKAHELSSVPFARATGLNAPTEERAQRKYQSLYDFMRSIWNNTNSGRSPAKYFGGVLIAGEIDAAGDIVYYYNRPYVESGRIVESVDVLKAELGL